MGSILSVHQYKNHKSHQILHTGPSISGIAALGGLSWDTDDNLGVFLLSQGQGLLVRWDLTCPPWRKGERGGKEEKLGPFGVFVLQNINQRSEIWADLSLYY